MGILIFGAGTLLGLFLGIVLISLLTMAQKADQVYDLMAWQRGNRHSRLTTYRFAGVRNRVSPTSRAQVRPRRDWRIAAEGGAVNQRRNFPKPRFPGGLQETNWGK